jgi:stage V sporulation protein R
LDIQVADVDLLGERHLLLHHKVRDGVLLEEGSCEATLRHIRRLWGYPVSLVGIDAETGAALYEKSSEELAE